MIRYIRNTFSFLLVFLSISAWSDDTYVYVTRTGEKYHRESCRYLSKSCILISLENAIARGYTPCKVCKPPTLQKPESEPQQVKIPELYQVNVQNIWKTSDATLSLMIKGTVVRIVDGDTIVVKVFTTNSNLDDTETIRLIGIDTPETVDPRKSVQYFGKEASAYTSNKLNGKDIYLSFDYDLRDKYNRLLAYIYNSEGICFNLEIIQDGYAKVYVEYPFQFMNEFINA